LEDVLFELEPLPPEVVLPLELELELPLDEAFEDLWLLETRTPTTAPTAARIMIAAKDPIT
jgi:hypothetical protein